MTLLNIERAKYSVWYLQSRIKYEMPQVKNKIANWIKNQFLVKRMASFVLVSVMLPITILPIATPEVAIDKSYQSHIVLNATKADLLPDSTNITQIIPGESQAQKLVREQAEAAAKAAAEAKTKLATSTRNTVTREKRVYNDPSDFDTIYARAEATYGVDASVLKAIHQVETGGSGSTGLTNHSGSGATGPMQFLPSTWRRHGVDGNGDGIADINNVEDAIFSAAAYLKACGYPNVKKALWGYNPSISYYNRVIKIAGM